MANKVFANGLEIACQAAAGKSVACFPDVCFTPPSPPAGWIPIPYANTTYAKDTTNGSKTVFISGKPVMKKDLSFFKTSTGNEPAAGPQGVVTHVKKGKAYFASWSMNVKIEGQNVDRHTDLITHNHGSAPGNTATWAYTDSAASKPPKECTDDCVKIERECNTGVSKQEAEQMCKGSKSGEKTKPKPDKVAAKKTKGNMAAVFAEKFNEKIKSSITWKQKHCGVLMVNSCADAKAIDAQLKELTNVQEQANKIVQQIPETVKSTLDGLTSEINSELAKDIIVKAAIGWDMEDGVIRGLGKFAFRKIPYVGQAASVARGVELAAEANKIVDELNKGAAEQVNQFKQQMEQTIKQAQDAKDNLEKFKNGELSKEDFLKLQKAQANADPCVKARKCLLVPYKDSTGKNLLSDKGCCPGQTGHHLIPNSMIVYPKGEAKKTGKEQVDGCPGYKHGEAPTVCVEGTDQNQCTHQEIHESTKVRLEEQYTKPTGENKINLGAATDTVEKAHQDTFVASECKSTTKGRKGCQKAQLENYFKKVCGDNWRATYVRAVDGMTSKKH